MDNFQDIHVSSTEVHHHERREQQQFHYEENEGGSTIIPLTVESRATTHDGHSIDQKRQQNYGVSNNTCLRDIANDNVVDDSDNDSEEDEVDEEDNDEFDCDAIAMPRLTSSTVPIVIDSSNHHRNAGFYSSNDPLFQGVCLYSTTATGKSTTTTPIRDHNDSPSNGHDRNGSTNLTNTIATFPIGQTESSSRDEALMPSNESCTTSVLPSSSTKRSCEEIYHWYIPPSVFRLFVKNR